MYWENSTTVTREVDVTDTAKLDDHVQIPKINVIFIIFSTLVEGIATRVYEKEGFDNYQIILDGIQNISQMFAWDDNDGGWFRNASPLAVDGYSKSFVWPGLYSYSKANYISWMFTGVQLTPAEWASTEAARDALK